MQEQRGWRERYGVDDWEFHHTLAAIAALMIFTAPVVALLRDGDVGLVFFAAGLFAFFWAVALTPDEN